MSNYPDGVTQSMIDAALDGGYDTRCRDCRQEPCECCQVCGATPDKGCDLGCTCLYCLQMGLL